MLAARESANSDASLVWTRDKVSFRRVARIEDIPPGETRYFCLDEKPLLLAKREGTVYALSGLCPHRQNPLEGAVLWGDLVDCPWHHFQYDVRTGVNHFPRNVYPKDMPQLEKQLRPLETYEVEVRGGEIWVKVE